MWIFFPQSTQCASWCGWKIIFLRHRWVSNTTTASFCHAAYGIRFESAFVGASSCFDFWSHCVRIRPALRKLKLSYSPYWCTKEKSVSDLEIPADATAFFSSSSNVHAASTVYSEWEKAPQVPLSQRKREWHRIQSISKLCLIAHTTLMSTIILYLHKRQVRFLSGFCQCKWCMRIWLKSTVIKKFKTQNKMHRNALILWFYYLKWCRIGDNKNNAVNKSN